MSPILYPSVVIRTWAKSLTVLFVLAIGCGGPPSAPPEAPSISSEISDASPSASIDSTELERLQALGYLDTTGIPKAGPGGGVTVIDPTAAYHGYSLVVFASPCRAELLDPSGEVIGAWSDSPCHMWHDVELLSNNDVVVVGASMDHRVAEDPIRDGRYIARLGRDGASIWRKDIAAHHEIEITPRGQILTLVMERRRLPEVDPVNEVVDERLTLLSLGGELIESFSIYDVLVSSSPPFELRVTGSLGDGGTAYRDLLHCNAARWSDGVGDTFGSPTHAPDTVLVTSRHQDALLAIHWPTRRLVWSWGPGVLSGPHAGSPLANGNILVFDNGLERGWSRVLEVNPLAPERSTQFAPKGAQLFSRVMGDCQRLPNGNTLFVHSEGGSAVELTPQGRPVWRYEATHSTPTGHRAKIARLDRLAPAPAR